MPCECVNDITYFNNCVTVARQKKASFVHGHFIKPYNGANKIITENKFLNFL